MTSDYTLEELEKLVDDTIRKIRCNRGAYSKCGCGMIHGLMYTCRYHYLELKSNTFLVIKEYNERVSLSNDKYFN